MRTHRLFISSTCLMLLSAGIAHAQPPSDAATLAVKIDQHLAKRWSMANVTPAPGADDAEFVRRVYLDLAGRIPTVAETRSFLADKKTDRRQQLIERLLASPRYSIHFAGVYRALLIPEAGNNFLVRFQQGSFEDWLKLGLKSNAGFDKITRDLLTAPVGNEGALAVFSFNNGPSPIAFYSAKDFKAESLAAGAARVFLGVRVECAQCHHHPFADWKKEQFWGLAAFFSGINSQRAGDVLIPAAEMPNKRELTIPGTETVVQAKFLDGKQPDWKESAATPTRSVLASWMTSRANPYFARATVNRTWAYFLGTGLVEPIDDMVGAGATASHPELLDLLAREFVEHNFDLKFLIRAITLTDAYQRTSAGTDKAQGEPTHFARMPLRGQTPEQLFDSLVTATGFRSGESKESLLDAISGKSSARAQILSRFTNLTERPTMSQTSILHALTLMNGKIVADATSLEKSETLAALVDAPFLSTADRVETLYFAALSRRPSAKEIDRMTRFVEEAVREAGNSDKMRSKAYNDAISDVFWVLLNSSEFALNH
jgi:Protein of unknown function (DUF1553)/Protein of unknown function (DUF1549)